MINTLTNVKRTKKVKILKDLTGQRFSKLIVLGIYGIKENSRNSVWLCKCDCGTKLIAEGSQLTRGRKNSCGCNSLKNLAGKRFGRLVALNISKRIIEKGKVRPTTFWNCKCDCGNFKEIRVSSPTGNKTKSCGCFQKYLIACRNSINKRFKEISGSYLHRIKYNAKEANHLFNISNKYIWNLFLKQNRKCAISGLPINFTVNARGQTASLDRINSKKGYIKNNVQWVHKDVNSLKSDFDEKYFIFLCKKIFLNQKNK